MRQGPARPQWSGTVDLVFEFRAETHLSRLRSNPPRDRSPRRQADEFGVSPSRASGSPLAHVDAVLVEPHRVCSPGVDFSTPASDFLIPSLCGIVLRFRVETANQFEGEAGALFGKKTNRKACRRATRVRSEDNDGQAATDCRSFVSRLQSDGSHHALSFGTSARSWPATVWIFTKPHPETIAAASC